MTDQQQAGSPSRRGRGRHVRPAWSAASIDAADERQNSLWSDAWKALKRNPLFWIGSVLGVFFVLMALVPQLFARGADPRDCDLTNSKATPSADHWFGFDQQGCDYLAQVVYGARSSLIIGILAVVGVADPRRHRRRASPATTAAWSTACSPGSPTSSSPSR